MCPVPGCADSRLLGRSARPTLKLVLRLLAGVASRIDHLFIALVKLPIRGLDAGFHAVAQRVARFDHGRSRAIDHARRRSHRRTTLVAPLVTIAGRRRGWRRARHVRSPTRLAREIRRVASAPAVRPIPAVIQVRACNGEHKQNRSRIHA